MTHDASTRPVVGKTKVGKIIIGNNVFIGFGSIILPNCKIGDNVVIGAGSVVTRDIPSNSVAAGNPCRVVGNYENFKKKHLLAISDERHPIVDGYMCHDPEIQNDIKDKLEKTWGYN